MQFTHRKEFLSVLAVMLIMAFSVSATRAEDWTMWGGTPERNMVSKATGIPSAFNPGSFKPGTEEIASTTTQNVKWIAKLGSQAFGNPTVANGRVYVGTNNEQPRDPALKGDRSVLFCLDEKTGKLLWQLNVPKLGTGKVSDWEFLGICSSPAIENDRVYVVTNRCELLCLDALGMANGNDGPFKYEKTYTDGTLFPLLEQGKTPPSDDATIKTPPDYADIIWRYDLRAELGVFPHNISSNAPLIVGDNVYIATSNGVDWSHINIPNPNAPSLISVNKNTGELTGEEAQGICKIMFHCNWSSPAYAVFGGVPQLIFGAGDGFVYGFDPKPVKGEGDANVFKEFWRFDCDPPSYRVNTEGKPIKYATFKGPSELIATPVIYKNKIYVAIGQDPEHGEGIGNFSCMDPTKRGDISKDGKVWTYSKINRSISTAAINDDLVYISDYAGEVHCLDANTGEPYWVHSTGAHIWGSPLAVDGKVYIGTEDGALHILKQGKKLEPIAKIEFPAPIYSTAVVANGTLYVGTQTHLYAFATGGK